MSARTRIEAARYVVAKAEERALTRDEWDDVAQVYDAIETDVRRMGDVSDHTALMVLSIGSIACRPLSALAYGVRYAESQSHPGERHELRRFGSRWACGCRGWRERRTCSHAKAEEQRDRDAAATLTEVAS